MFKLGMFNLYYHWFVFCFVSCQKKKNKKVQSTKKVLLHNSTNLMCLDLHKKFGTLSFGKATLSITDSLISILEHKTNFWNTSRIVIFIIFRDTYIGDMS